MSILDSSFYIQDSRFTHEAIQLGIYAEIIILQRIKLGLLGAPLKLAYAMLK